MMNEFKIGFENSENLQKMFTFNITPLKTYLISNTIVKSGW
jgi:hypothetical protein